LIGLAEVDGDLFDGGSDEEQLGADFLGEEAKSLSITAAVPSYSPFPKSTTGMPPPPMTASFDINSFSL
jgi:hypothetical protein